MAEGFSKYGAAEEPAEKRVPFWKRPYGHKAPIASRLARKMSGLEFEILLDSSSVRRGEAVAGTLKVSKRRGRRKTIELGLVCTESYDVETTTYVNNRTQRSRTTKRATAHEQWLPLETDATEHVFSLSVPEGAPFSYAGDALSFSWQLRAVSRARLRPDAARHWPVSVIP